MKRSHENTSDNVLIFPDTPTTNRTQEPFDLENNGGLFLPPTPSTTTTDRMNQQTKPVPQTLSPTTTEKMNLQSKPIPQSQTTNSTPPPSPFTFTQLASPTNNNNQSIANELVYPQSPLPNTTQNTHLTPNQNNASSATRHQSSSNNYRLTQSFNAPFDEQNEYQENTTHDHSKLLTNNANNLSRSLTPIEFADAKKPADQSDVSSTASTNSTPSRTSMTFLTTQNQTSFQYSQILNDNDNEDLDAANQAYDAAIDSLAAKIKKLKSQKKASDASLIKNQLKLVEPYLQKMRSIERNDVEVLKAGTAALHAVTLKLSGKDIDDSAFINAMDQFELKHAKTKANMKPDTWKKVGAVFAITAAVLLGLTAIACALTIKGLPLAAVCAVAAYKCGTLGTIAMIPAVKVGASAGSAIGSTMAGFFGVKKLHQECQSDDLALPTMNVKQGLLALSQTA